MAAAENELDIDDYYNLSLDERYQLDDWLRSLGGRPIRTRKITLHDTYVTVEEYALATDDSLTYNWKTKDVDILVREFKYDVGPPIWKKLCPPEDDTSNENKQK